MQTIDQLIRQRVGDHRAGLFFVDRTWTHDQVVQAQADRAAVLASLRRPGPFHVALLLDNVPEYVFWMGAAALAGAVLVGGNPTHRGDELARDLVPHRVPAAGDQRATTGPWSTGTTSGPALPPDRILVIDDPCGDLSSPATPYGALVGGGDRRPPPRPGRHGGHRGIARTPAVHLGHLGRPQGLPVQPGAAGPHRRHRGPDVRADRGRRLLPGHAPVPLQRPDGRMGPGPVRRGHGGPAGAVQRLAVPRRRAALRRHLLQLRGQAAVVHPGHAPSVPTTPTTPCVVLRQRGGRGRRGPVRRAVRLHGAGRLRLDRGRGRGDHARPTPPGVRWAGPCPAP